jgi:putative nucleotidyltransferase with HDIG domain
MAVYSVKRTGKNAVQIYSTEILHRETVTQHKSGYSENASTIYALSAAIDAKDHYTFQHSENVAYYAMQLAKSAGMDSDLVEIVREASLLHDIGKISVREDILNKPGKLTPAEFEIMKGHVESAVSILSQLPSLEYVIPTVYSHHEHYDGSGYPRRLKGEEIPIIGRILCIADAFDAMISTRSYKQSLSKEEALEILKNESGKQFDPKLVLIFLELFKQEKIEVRTQT